MIRECGRWFVVLFLTGVFSCGNNEGNGEEGNGARAVPVRVEVLERRDFTVFGEYYGIAEPIVEALLIAHAGGRVTALYAEEGVVVREGASLGRVDALEAIANYERTQIAEQVALTTWRLRQKQQRRGTVSEVTAKEARLAYLDAKNARLRAAKVRDGALCITPITGLVVLRFIDLYDELGREAPTFRVARLDTVQVRIGIPENDIAELTEGNEALVRIDAVPDERFPAIVSRVARALTPETQTYQVFVRVYNKDLRIISGLKALVRLALRVIPNRIVVPSDAILTEVDRHYVMIAVDGKAERRRVRIGPTGDTRTVVWEGLEAGDSLLVTGQERVRDGMPLRIEGRR
ncbi:MAG: efflux RND transporter periplasmic adaptor subunit [Chitinivibrionales bacterium]|nr:efflux RND transporter periplasmic adaptor subunit [Chitinivibrionales bacterium]MBD3358168.1 efflux RND transporter periplasmic adaptor subunit [Chitinivibrionales bacterium]